MKYIIYETHSCELFAPHDARFRVIGVYDDPQKASTALRCAIQSKCRDTGARYERLIGDPNHSYVIDYGSWSDFYGFYTDDSN